jgi:hypothetical protein
MTRQAGSHIRLTTAENGEHHITIPAHNPLKIGTLTAILADLEFHHKMKREELLKFLFSKISLLRHPDLHLAVDRSELYSPFRRRRSMVDVWR